MSLSKIGNLKSAFKSRSTSGVSSALAAFGDVGLAGKWLGQINVGKNGKNIMTQEKMINLLKSKYIDASEEEILNALNKGAANASASTMAATGATGVLGTLKNTGAGLVTFLKPFLPVIIGAAVAGIGYTGFKALDNQIGITKSGTSKKYQETK